MDLAKGTINDAEAAANWVVANVTPQVLTVEDHAVADAQGLHGQIADDPHAGHGGGNAEDRFMDGGSGQVQDPNQR